DRPRGGRSDDKGYGTVDPAAAIEAGKALKPGDPKNATAGHRGQYFGPGPQPAPEESGAPGLLAPLAGGLGALLLLTAVVLHRAGRTR
ncbi:type VII secretion-associated serine protease mycosin, partial [Streptomyces hydrogenans]